MQNGRPDRAGAGDVPDVLRLTLYEKAINQAREDQARRENKKPEEVQPDLTDVNFEKPQQHLQKAVEAQPRAVARPLLPRPHLPRHRQAEGGRRRADQGAQLRTRPSRGRRSRSASSTASGTTPIRRSQVAQQGAAVVPGANEVSDIWYVVGMGYDDKRTGRQGDRGVRQGAREPARQPQGEVPARAGVLPQGRLHQGEEGPRGVLEVGWRVGRVREAAGEQDAAGHRREVGDAEQHVARRLIASRSPLALR